MPIEKIPLVHRFGIISHAQRLELQERLLKKSYLETFATQKAGANARNNLEVTEEFIQHYNGTEDLSEREKLDATASKMLHRIKRRAGVKEGGTGDHVDLPLAWTELSQLAQCKGKIQEECLDVLITSLDQAPLHKLNIPALFFLAETTLYWLRTDAVHQPYLRTGEIKLLRMGALVFCRLFFHHMAGHLQNKDEFKNRLFTYLDGFAESQEAYSPYPNALFCVRYIIEVGKIVIGDCYTEAGEIKEGDRIAGGSPSQSEYLRDAGPHRDDDAPVSTHSRSAGSISTSVHDLSPTLWHALDVWRCEHTTGGRTDAATRALAECGRGLAEESWVDGVTALQILADSAKTSPAVLKTLQNLARGVKPEDKRGNKGAKDSQEEAYAHVHDQEEPYKDPNKKSSPSTGTDQQPSKQTNHSLSDIYENPYSGANSSAPKSRNTNTAETPQRSAKSSQKPGVERHRDSAVSKGAVSHSAVSKGAVTTVPDTAWRAEAGTEQGRASQASTVATYGNNVHPDSLGLHGWRWEVAITYADVLADVCLHGNTSTIQKAALVGTRKDLTTLHKTATTPQCPMASAGLLDLVYFHAAQERLDGGSQDWSWRIRYAAIQGLVKICRCCASESTKEGMRTVAWSHLVRAHSLERDQRVLEALKVGQVESNIENLLNAGLDQSPGTVGSKVAGTIGSKVAGGLSMLYLPPLPPPVEPPPLHKRRSPSQKTGHPTPARNTEKKPLRTSLKEEIALASALTQPVPSLGTRMNFDLKRVVEDQWRKALQAEVEAEAEEKRVELERSQEEDEVKQAETEDKRRDKLKDKYRGKAYQYQDFSKMNLTSGKKDKEESTAVARKSSSDSSLFGVRGCGVKTS